MKRYFIELAYKGEFYSGWQIQDNAQTVQQELNSALSVLAGHPIQTTGCGRTDAGVHASQFFAHFDIENEVQDVNNWCYRLNSILPKGINVFRLFEVNQDDHSRFSALNRTYHYFLHHQKTAFNNSFSVYHSTVPDIDYLNQVSALLLGERSFKSLSKSNTQVNNYNCRIAEATWSRSDHQTIFKISSNRFLRGMVRGIVGTLLEYDLRKPEPSTITATLDSEDRGEAGVTAAAHGLFLTGIEYPFIQKISRPLPLIRSL